MGREQSYVIDDDWKVDDAASILSFPWREMLFNAGSGTPQKRVRPVRRTVAGLGIDAPLVADGR